MQLMIEGSYFGAENKFQRADKQAFKQGNISGANQPTCANLETTNQDHYMLIQ